jgi:hypothetical protein
MKHIMQYFKIISVIIVNFYALAKVISSTANIFHVCYAWNSFTLSNQFEKLKTIILK